MATVLQKKKKMYEEFQEEIQQIGSNLPKKIKIKNKKSNAARAEQARPNWAIVGNAEHGKGLGKSQIQE